MDRRTYLKASTAVVTGGVTALAGCSQDEGPDGTTTDGGDGGGSNTVRMVTDGSEYYFDPIGLSVDAGATVTWRNESGAHSSTAYVDGNGPATVTRVPEGASGWNSQTRSEQGVTFEHTFETTGTYDYFCIPHKSLGMVGRVVVGDPGGPAEGSMPPDGDVPESAAIVEQGAVAYSDFQG